MTWWMILIAGLVAGVIVLALAVRPVLARLPVLMRALTRLEQRAAEAEQLQGPALALQERLEELATKAGQAQRRRETRRDAAREAAH